VNTTATTNNTQQTQQSQQAEQSKQTANKQPVQTTARPEEVAVEIKKAAQSGADRINIQLKPLELGKIEVQLDMTGNKVVATIVAERPETLSMLKDDISSLQKALGEAGLDLGDMNFNLNSQNDANKQFADGSQNEGQGNSGLNQQGEPEEELLLASQMDLSALRSATRAAQGGVDISA